jgi:thioredoxin reductase (NADPH)
MGAAGPVFSRVQSGVDSENELLDLLIVGAGPAGLAAGCAAQDAGLSYAVVERCGPVQSLVEHPQQIRYFSPADEMAVGGVPFFVAGGHKPTREDALAYYRAVAASRRLNLATWEEVVSAERTAEGFSVTSERRAAGSDGPPVVRRARLLLVCAGTFPNPRRPRNVAGADLPKVLYRLYDPTPFFGRDVLVVGGGNSAATAAMTLSGAGARVTLAMRREPREFQSHLRPFIVRDLKIMAEEGRLALLSDARLVAITTSNVTLRCGVPYEAPDEQCAAFGEPRTLPNDFVFAMLGHAADAALFERLGLPLAPDGLPVYDEETAESPVPGAFVAGSLSRANIILESRRRAVEIVALVCERLGRAGCGRIRDPQPP